MLACVCLYQYLCVRVCVCVVEEVGADRYRRQQHRGKVAVGTQPGVWDEEMVRT